MRVFLLSIFFVLILSCKDEKPPITINGSSQEQYTKSLEEMKNSMPDSLLAKFDEALLLLNTYKAHAEGDSLKASMMRRFTNGKTYEEIFDLAELTSEEYNLNWTRTTPVGNLDLNASVDSNISKNMNPDMQVGIKDASQITVTAIEKDKDGDDKPDGLMVFIKFMDKSNNTVTFSGENMRTVLTLDMDGDRIYTSQKNISSSAVGNTSSSNGLFVPFNSINWAGVNGKKANLEVRVNTPSGYLTQVVEEVPFDGKNWKPNSKPVIEYSEEDKSTVQSKVSSFLTHLGNKELQKAYNMSDNPKWASYKDFSSPTAGFGSITKIEKQSVSTQSVKDGTAKVTANYKVYSSELGNLQFKQVFTLKDMGEGNWKIVATDNVSAPTSF